jgi:hypothetical protein
MSGIVTNVFFKHSRFSKKLVQTLLASLGTQQDVGDGYSQVTVSQELNVAGETLRSTNDFVWKFSDSIVNGSDNDGEWEEIASLLVEDSGTIEISTGGSDENSFKLLLEAILKIAKYESCWILAKQSISHSLPALLTKKEVITVDKTDLCLVSAQVISYCLENSLYYDLGWREL